jgi:hypothetical protein
MVNGMKRFIGENIFEFSSVLVGWCTFYFDIFHKIAVEVKDIYSFLAQPSGLIRLPCPSVCCDVVLERVNPEA